MTSAAGPVVRFVTPTEDQPFAFGDTVAFEVGSPTTSRSTAAACGHLHPRARRARAPADHGLGCTGSITTTVPTGHDPADDDLHAVFVAEYTDAGGGTLPPLTGSDEVVLEPAG